MTMLIAEEICHFRFLRSDCLRPFGRTPFTLRFENWHFRNLSAGDCNYCAFHKFFVTICWARQDLDWGDESVPRAIASRAFAKGRSLPLAVLIRSTPYSGLRVRKLWLELFTRASFLIGQNRKQGD